MVAGIHTPALRRDKAAAYPVSCLLNPMSEPLGCAAGNALEVTEICATMYDDGPPDLVALTLDLAAAVTTTPRE